MDIDYKIYNPNTYKYARKVLNYPLGEYVGTFTRSIYALDNSVAIISIHTASSISVSISVNDVVVYSDTLLGVASVPVTLFKDNTISLTVSSAAYVTLSIDGSVLSDNYYPRLTAIDNFVLGTDSANYYISSINEGNFDIFAQQYTLQDIYTFNSLSIANVYAYYDNSSIVVTDMSDNSTIATISVDTVPSSICVCNVTDTFDYCVLALYDGSIKCYCINSGVVSATYTANTSMVSIRSIPSATMQCLCIKAGASHIATISISGGVLSISLRQISTSVDTQVYIANSNTYVLTYSGGIISFKLLSADYECEYSARYIGEGAVVYNDKLYIVHNNYMQVVYES